MAELASGLWVPSKVADEWNAEQERSYQESVRRIEKGADAGSRSVRAPDPYDLREHTRDSIAGRDRKPEVWAQVMEHWSFVWLEPHQLDRYVGKFQVVPPGLPAGAAVYFERAHTEGQWRNDYRKTRDGTLLRIPTPRPYGAAFTLNDLISNFGGAPVTFDRWWRGERLKYAKRRAPRL